MNRLTTKRNGKNVIPLLNAVCGIDMPHWQLERIDDLNTYLSGDAADKLAEYEDAEEQGLLVRLPCKVGDRVYRIHTHDHIEERSVMAIHVSASGVWYWDETGRETPVEKIGKTVFLTREEAEAALNKEEHNG